MSYTPLKISGSPQTSYSNSLMPRSGINKEDFSQVVDFNFALDLINYIPQRFGLEKRRGQLKIAERVGAFPVTLLEEFLPNVWIVGYSTKIEAYNANTGTWTTIKSNFSANNGFDGERYGQFFLVCNGVEKIWRIDNALAITEIANSPVCSGIKIIGARAYAYNLSTDSTAVQYSDIDDGSDPPFDDWNETSAADTGGHVSYRNAGTVRSVCQQGQFTVVFSDKGFYAFLINVVDSAGTLKKVEVIQNYTTDYGGARGAIETQDGIYYANEAGLWLMTQVGSTDTPMSRQQVLVSVLLSNKFFEGVDQTSIDIIQDISQKIILMTCAKDSTRNNLVLGFKPELKAMFQIKGWNINRFAKSGEEIYGASSVKATFYKLFSGYDDDGFSIGTYVRQEVPLKTLYHAHSLSEFLAGGQLSQGAEYKIAFDIYDIMGLFQKDKAVCLWIAGAGNLSYSEWASANWGNSGYGGTDDNGGMVNSFDGGSPVISNFQRLIYSISSGDKLPHVLNWIAFKTTRKQPILRRHITQII